MGDSKNHKKWIVIKKNNSQRSREGVSSQTSDFSFNKTKKLRCNKARKRRKGEHKYKIQDFQELNFKIIYYFLWVSFSCCCFFFQGRSSTQCILNNMMQKWEYVWQSLIRPRICESAECCICIQVEWNSRCEEVGQYFVDTYYIYL